MEALWMTVVDAAARFVDRSFVGDVDAPVVDAFQRAFGRQIENDDLVATGLERACNRCAHEAAAPCYQTNGHELLDCAKDDVG